MNPESTGWFCSECRTIYDDYDEAYACCDPEEQALFDAEKERREAAEARRALETAGQLRIPLV